MSGRNQIQDTRPLASRAVSNRELVKMGFRRASITKKEHDECVTIARNMMFESEIQFNQRDVYYDRTVRK